MRVIEPVELLRGGRFFRLSPSLRGLPTACEHANSKLSIRAANAASPPRSSRWRLVEFGEQVELLAFALHGSAPGGHLEIVTMAAPLGPPSCVPLKDARQESPPGPPVDGWPFRQAAARAYRPSSAKPGRFWFSLPQAVENPHCHDARKAHSDSCRVFLWQSAGRMVVGFGEAGVG